MTVLVLGSASVQAQVYKCQRGQEVVYSDSTCASGSRQTVTSIQPAPLPAPSASSTPANHDPLSRQLDQAFRQAMRSGDLIRAQALAGNEQQKEQVAKASREAAAKQASNTASKADSQACAQARTSLQQEADSYYQDNTALNAKSGLMRLACGLPEPAMPYANGYQRGFFPGLQGGYPYPGNTPGHGHHPPPGMGGSGYTSEPYDRTIAPPFGSRFIRP